MALYVRPTFDSTPLVKVTKAKLIELRNALKSSDDPISNATINTLFASLSSAYSYFVEQGWCSENPLRLIEDLEVAERPFTWLQSAGEVQKLLSESRRDGRLGVPRISALTYPCHRRLRPDGAGALTRKRRMLAQVREHETELFTFLQGIFIHLLRLPIISWQDGLARERGVKSLSDEDWEKLKKEATRNAYQQVATSFPEPLRSKIAAAESAYVAHVRKENWPN